MAQLRQHVRDGVGQALRLQPGQFGLGTPKKRGHQRQVARGVILRPFGAHLRQSHHVCPRARSKIQNIGRHIAYVVQLANIGRHTFSQHGPLLSPLTCLLLCRFLGFLALLLGVPRGVQCPQNGLERRGVFDLAGRQMGHAFIHQAHKLGKARRIFGSERQTALRDLIQQAPRRMACIREETRVKAHQLFERLLQLLYRELHGRQQPRVLRQRRHHVGHHVGRHRRGFRGRHKRNRVDGLCQLHWRTPGGQRRRCLGSARQAVHQPFQLGHVFHGVHGHGRNCCVSRSQWARYAGHGSGDILPAAGRLRDHLGGNSRVTGRIERVCPRQHLAQNAHGQNGFLRLCRQGGLLGIALPPGRRTHAAAVVPGSPTVSTGVPVARGIATTVTRGHSLLGSAVA